MRAFEDLLSVVKILWIGLCSFAETESFGDSELELVAQHKRMIELGRHLGGFGGGCQDCEQLRAARGGVRVQETFDSDGRASRRALRFDQFRAGSQCATH